MVLSAHKTKCIHCGHTIVSQDGKRWVHYFGGQVHCIADTLAEPPRAVAAAIADNTGYSTSPGGLHANAIREAERLTDRTDTETFLIPKAANCRITLYGK